jgi:uncharacterized lipoprotein YddW (UPF0748 family)
MFRTSLLLALACALSGAHAQTSGHTKPKQSRFQVAAPLPSLPPVTLDVLGNGWGAAQQMARAKNLQGRILWVDGTANLDRVSTDEKIANFIAKVKQVGFNTVVFDVKPIVGYTLYPSKLTDKLLTWRGQNLPKNQDPLKAMVRECKKHGLSLLVSMNAFSEGHRMALQAQNAGEGTFGTKPGPGYEMPDQQTVLYEPRLEARVPFTSAHYPISPTTDKISPKGAELAVFTNLSKLPKTPPTGAVGVILDGTGAAILIAESKDWDFKVVPEGGSLLVGTGDGAAFLRKNIRIGYGVVFDAIPQFVTIAERPEQQIPLMMNPHHPEVQKRGLNFIKEVLTNYDVDGVMFDDRLRYGGLNADFSEITRKQFEALVGEKLEWPRDVFTFTYGPDLGRGVKPGKWYDAWMAFRAETIRNWVAEARKVAVETRPGSLFGVYAGSWFGEYHKYGAHYGSTEFTAGFSFLTDGYRKAGFASELDLMISGCYYRRATISEAMEKYSATGKTVEAAGQLTNRAIRDQAWSYAGIQLMDYWGNEDGLKKALQAATGSTQGVMVFDASHRIEQYWDIFAKAFKTPAKAPHAQAGLLQQVRNRRVEMDKLGVKEPPVIIREGAPGAGF